MQVRGLGRPARIVLIAALLVFGVVQGVSAATVGSSGPDLGSKIARTLALQARPAQRQAAAERLKVKMRLEGLFTPGGMSATGVAASALVTATPGGQPDYFGTVPNWSYTPPIRKFVDGLPGLGAANANNLGQYLSVAHPDTRTYPGSDYYEIELREYTQKMHSDLPPTTLRGYVQVNMGTNTAGTAENVAPDPIHYLGPTILATKDRPVRVKFTNKLPTGSGGDLYLPVDTTVMGAGMGPLMMDVPAGQPMDYTQNRAVLHLHGGKTPWISDGTPHQWITPAGENTPYPKGVSVQNVPDMPDPGDGSMTFFYTNQQSARMMWYHDHAYGITRLNVYSGEAAGYMLTDAAEQTLINDGIIPSDQIPLIIQDKTFVDAKTTMKTDPTWNWGQTPGTPNTGDLWFPHVYMPNQNPYDVSGANAMGRWDYGPWFFPPTTDIQFGPVPNPYYDPINAPWEPPVMPGVPATSSVMEAFMDTPLVNGTAYPTVTLQPKSYRFRILNGANDRFWNLQLYQADPAVVTCDGRGMTEVKMVPAGPTAGFPALWPVDGRDGGVPDPNTVGPDFIQIGNEAGFLPQPTVVKNQPVDWNRNMKTFTFGNVSSHALLVAPAERADVIVDFSKYAGKTLILYNDAPAAFPARDPRVDYYTGDLDNTDTGGTATTEVGRGPNTRTIMQIKIAGVAAAPAYDMSKLTAAFVSTPTKPGVFAASQDPIIVGQAPYDSTYATSFPSIFPLWGYSRIQDTTMTISTVAGTHIDLHMEPKALHDEMGGAYDQYGRMMGKLGLEVPTGNAVTQQFIGQSYIDPATENILDSVTPMAPVAGDGTQIWKITHNGVDTHPIHFHLFNVQLLNRVGWDGAIELPDPNELGWKETVRVSPLEDTIVALRPVAPQDEFGVPDSIRFLDPTQPPDATMGFTNLDTLTGDPLASPTLNQIVNFGWEYMWHCHILSHEEMEMMRPIDFAVGRSLPATPTASATGVSGAPVALAWDDATVPGAFGTRGNLANEVGFHVMRAPLDAGGVAGAFSVVATAPANTTAYVDRTTIGGRGYRYKVGAFNAATVTLGSDIASGFSDVMPLGRVFFASYVTTPSAGPNGSISPATPQGTPVASPTDLTFTITPDTGYHIETVKVDGLSVGTAGTHTILAADAGNHTITATFAVDMFTLAPTVGPNLTVSPGVTRTVPYGTLDVPFTFTALPGYHVASVVVDSVSVGAIPPGPFTHTFTNIQGNHTISATAAADVMLPVFRFYNMRNGSHFYTINVAERDSIIALQSFTYLDESVAYSINQSNPANVTPLFRFFNFRNGTHFYTASVGERDSIIANLAGTYRYENIAYYVSAWPCPAPTIPVFRFYNFRNDTHFFTANPDERDWIIATMSSSMRFEGIGFYVGQ